MELFVHNFLQILVLFIIILIGLAARLFKVMHKDFDSMLSTFVINVTTPLLILSSAMGEVLPNKEDIAPVFFYSALCMIAFTLVSIPLTRIMRCDAMETGVFRFILTCGNLGFIGFPVVGVLFGASSIFYAAVMTLPSNLIIYSIGYLFLVGTAKKALLSFKLLISPMMLATYGSIILVYFQIRVPAPLGEACRITGSATIPLSLLIIGSSLAVMGALDLLGSLKLYVICLFKLLILPFLCFVVLSLCPVQKQYLQVIVVLMGMPVAAVGVMFVLKEGIDPRLMTQGTFLTTLLSLFTIPLLALLF